MQTEHVQTSKKKKLDTTSETWRQRKFSDIRQHRLLRSEVTLRSHQVKSSREEKNTPCSPLNKMTCGIH